jgi:hypothetical protein
VRDEHVGESKLALEIFEQIDDPGADRHIQRRYGLVEHEQLGIEHERAGDPDALTLPAGELVRETVGVLAIEPDPPHHFCDTLSPPVLPQPVDLQRVGDDRFDGHRRIQRRVRILEHDLHLAAQLPQSLRIERSHIGAAVSNRTARGRYEV